jgi:hypothetical protein
VCVCVELCMLCCEYGVQGCVKVCRGFRVFRGIKGGKGGSLLGRGEHEGGEQGFAGYWIR